MTSLLRDPLIQLVMRSDGVTDEAHRALWHRTGALLAERRGMRGEAGALTGSGGAPDRFFPVGAGF